LNNEKKRKGKKKRKKAFILECGRRERRAKQDHLSIVVYNSIVNGMTCHVHIRTIMNFLKNL